MNITKSKNDSNKYKYFVLENGLQVILVQDKKTKKSAASVSVGIGSYSDPYKYPGLAHFLEHMLFMGSEKYPKENEYSEKLAKYGGSSNAYTDSQVTNYFFDVVNEHFDEMIDIFGQFFISPLFNKDSVYREMNAVDSENSKNLNNDYWRIDQLVRSFGNKNHPFSKFGTGNLDTLFNNHKENCKDEEGCKILIRQELINFYQKHYSSHKMSLVVLTNKNFDKIEDKIKNIFNNVKKSQVSEEKVIEKPFNDDSLNKIVFVKTIKDNDILSFLWDIQPIFDKYKCGVEFFISHLLGHEGLGSIFSYLKKLGYATSLYSGDFDNTSLNCILQINIVLTEKGIQNYKQIIYIVDRYIEILKNDGIQKWIYEENLNIGKMKFRFKTNPFPIDLVSSLSRKILECEYNDVFISDYYSQEYNPELLKKIITSLEKKNRLIMFCSKNIEKLTDKWNTDKKTEFWYKTEYLIDEIKDEIIDLNNQLYLPKPNNFIPKSFKRNKNNDIIKLEQTVGYEIWYKGCIKGKKIYKTPKTCLSIVIHTPILGNNLRSKILTDILKSLINESMSEYTYDAAIAGLNYSLSCNGSFCINFMGYDNNLIKLVNIVIDGILNLKVKQDRFEIYKDKMMKSFQSSKSNMPVKLANSYLYKKLLNHSWLPDKCINELKNIEYTEIENFINNELFSKCYFKFLCQGNKKIKNTFITFKNIMKKFKKRFNYTVFLDYNDEKYKNYCKIIDKNEIIINKKFVKEEINNAVSYYVQIGKFGETKSDYKNRVLTGLLNNIMGETFFDQLRTKENFGYICQTTFIRKYKMNGFVFYVQSTKDIEEIKERITRFIKEFGNKLEQMSVKEINTFIKSHRKNLNIKTKSLEEEHFNYFNLIKESSYEFNRQKNLVKTSKKIKKKDVIKFYKNVFNKENNNLISCVN